MRIAMLVDRYKPYISGITNYIDLNKQTLEDQGHDVFVFTFGDLDYEDQEPRIVRSPGLPLADTGYYLSMRYSRQAKKLLQTMDVAHVHHPFLSGRLALRYCRAVEVPVLFTNHTRYDLYAQAYLPMMPEEISLGLLQAYMPSFCEAVDLVISPSPGMERVLRELGVTARVEVVPNGVDLRRFHRAEPLARADFGFKDTDVLLIFSGRIAPEKNLDFLLRAFAGVAQALDDVYLLIVGGGQKPAVEDLQSLVVELGIQGRVLLTGQIPYEELPAHIAMCNAFVTASVTEVHPLSVIEAMGAGLPIVGIHSPGVGDSVEDGVTGFLSTHDLAAFTAKLTRLCLDASLRRRMGEAARQASTQYSIERTTKLMLAHYERLVYDYEPRHRRWDTRLRAMLERFLS